VVARLTLAISLVALLPFTRARADNLTVTGQVNDAAGQPVAGAELASYWQAEGDGMKAFDGATTDAQGHFSIKLNFYNRPVGVMVIDKDRKTGSVFSVEAKSAGQPVVVKLAPLVRLKGGFFCKEMNFKPSWTNVYIMTTDDARFVGDSSSNADFSVLLPPGKYKFWGYGTDITNVKQDLTVAADPPVMDMKTIAAPATEIAKHKGKAPPKWNVTDARGVKKDVTLADYKGKWVLVDFFTYWCGPCVARSIPNLIEMYDLHKDHRDKFEILAVHVQYAKDFKEYDQQIKDAKKKYWNDKDLPFPLLLDATKETLDSFGIRAFPTTILIDPDGKLVGEVGEEELEKKLPPVPASIRVPRALDHMMPFGVRPMPLDKAMEFLARMSRVDIRIDDSVLKDAGVSRSEMLQLDLGGSLTLRSWLNLLLEGPGLAFTTDDRGIVVTPRKPKSVPPTLSEPQQDCAKRINGLLDEKKEFAFKDATLAEICQSLEQATGENFVLDPAARKSGSLNPTTKVSGEAKSLPLRQSLQNLLDAAGLTFRVRDEVVFITPKAKATP
jgi:thiol-disulfide isomerase/thioredoxin